MVNKLKGQFLPVDCEVQVFRRMQNLKQKDMDVAAYIEEFHKLNMRSGHVENEREKVDRYLNGLRFNIQGEISLLVPKTVDECFQVALRAEEKLKRKSDQKSRGRCRSFRGRGKFGGKKHSERQEGESNQNEQNGDSNSRGSFRGRRPNGRGSNGGPGRGSSTFTSRCYNCN
ncbi:uncharacterized protein LOC131876737 [Cryptomeria japonica]|uniref:uncharacterized protein LOC131876737 n=1 Tax=Cryptomeria japonica TaxID=3369 RepID=UPI0027D9EDF7|nr:uncharacterized protein LOC131876737 [Cryptomeria japonica]